jgi:hypothetical protein
MCELRDYTEEEQPSKERRSKQMESAEKHKIVGEYDTILLDIWWGNGTPEMERQMFVLRTKLNLYMPIAKVITWGLRDPVLNPGVMKVANYGYKDGISSNNQLQMLKIICYFIETPNCSRAAVKKNTRFSLNHE